MAGNWALPSLTSTYTNFLAELVARDEDAATWFRDSSTNNNTLTVNTVRWNSSNKNWEAWSGSAWAVLTTTYGISITGYASHILGGNNTTLLGSLPYQSNVNSTTLLSPNTTTTKNFLTQTGTGTNGAIPVWGTIGVADITGAAPIASPTFTGSPVLPTGTTAVTQAFADNSTKLATTAFVLANGLPLSGTTPLINGTATAGNEVAAAHGNHIHPTDTSLASLAGANFTGPINTLIITETKTDPVISAGAITINLNLGSVFDVALNGPITTMTISNPPASGTPISWTLIFTADGIARSVNWPASVKWAGGVAPILTSTNTKKDFFSFYTANGGTTYQAFIAGQIL